MFKNQQNADTSFTGGQDHETNVLLCAAVLGTAFLCLVLIYGLTRYRIRQEEPIPNTILETETVRDMEGREAVNQSGVLPAAKMTQEEPKEEYFLVSEAGFLLVFCSDKSTICLYTHIPVTDFPERERARLMEGIWFPSMMDVYHYLESYTS